VVIRRAQHWLGTLVEIAIFNEQDVLSSGQIDRAMTLAFARTAQVHHSMSYQDPSSELSCFNRLPHGESFFATPDFLTVMQCAQSLYALSEGLFDVCAGVPEPMGSSADIEINEERASLRKRRDLRIDLSGIAKGHGVDVAVAALVDAGVTSGWVNAGGDLRVFGEKKIPVHVRDPSDHSRTHLLCELTDGALATSAVYEGALSTIVDPRRAALLPSPRSWSVQAPTCILADALTKIVAISGTTNHPIVAALSTNAYIL
jgi:FAD:protein FMN transferase